MTGPAEDLSRSSPSHVDPPNASSHNSETCSTNQTSVKSSSDPSSPAVTGNATPDLCISGCRHGTRGGGEMIRCCICGKWFHIKCLRLSQDECAGVWPCYDCRKIAQDLKSTKENVQTLTLLLQKLVDSHSRELEDLRSRCNKLENDNVTLSTKNNALEVEIASLKSSQKSKTEQDISLLIGSSIIRDIDATKLMNTKVVSLPGGHIKDVHNHIKNMGSTFKKVTVVVGGNDCTATIDPEPVDELLHQFKDMVAEAKRLSADINVATVLPRISDAENVTERIDALNAGIVSMCHTDEHTLINNDTYFKLTNGEINDGYFMPDGTHLTKAGTNRLAKCLKLDIRANVKNDITKSPPKKTYAESLRQRKFGAAPTATQAKTQGARNMPGVHGSRNQPTANATQRSGTAPPAGRPHHKLNTPSGGRPRSHLTQQHRNESRRNEPNSAYRYASSDNGSYGNGYDHYKSNDFYVNPDTRGLPRCYNCHELNHMVDSCRYKSKVTCFRCNGVGHKEKHCF